MNSSIPDPAPAADSEKRSDPWIWIIPVIFVVLKLAIHTFTNLVCTDFHRDEFLYIAEGHHMAAGYFSVPPFIGFAAALSRILFGESVFAYRIFPALAGAATLLLTARMAAALGGKRFAVFSACLAFFLSLAYLRANTLFQPVTFDLFFWVLLIYLVLRLVQTGSSPRWTGIGYIFGLALLNKYSVAVLAPGIALAFLLSPHRKLLFSKYVLWAIVLGLAAVLPNLVWQATHNWPVVYHMSELQRTQFVYVDKIQFLINQVLMNVHALAFWLFGLLVLLLLKPERKYQWLGILFLAVAGIILAVGGKTYYTLGLYPPLLAAGAYAVEKYTQKRLKWIRAVLVVLMVVTAVPAVPIGLPILKNPAMARYGKGAAKVIGPAPLQWESGDVHELPQDYADMTGWKELADIVIRTFQSLSPEQRTLCLIYAENYGQAGAIRYYGIREGLPEPISYSDQFRFWAPDSIHAPYLIYVNDDTADVRVWFSQVIETGRVSNSYFREGDLPVWLCSGPKDGFERFYMDIIKRVKYRFLTRREIR